MQTPEEMLLAARDASLRGDHQGAVDLCVAVLQQKPGHAQAVAFLGLSLWRARNFTQAADILHEALKHFPGQFELSLALLESLHGLGQVEQAMTFAATLPDGVRKHPQLQARLQGLETSAAGLRPPPEVSEELLNLHEQGEFKELEARLLLLLRQHPHWNFGQTVLASCMFMSSGRAVEAQSLRIPSMDMPAEQAEAVLRRQIGQAMSASRHRVLQQIDIAISRSPGDAHAKELLIRTRFEEGAPIDAAELAHIGAQVQSPLLGPFPQIQVFDDSLQGVVEVRRIEPPGLLEIPAPLTAGSRPLDLAGAIGPALTCVRYVGEARGAKVCAGSDVVLLPNGTALSDNLTHPLGELVNHHFDAWIVMGSVSQLVLRDLPTISVPGVAISLLGPAVRFYGHWLLDTLIRFRSIEEHPAAATACLLIDDGMPQSHIEALQLLLGGGRPMRAIPRGSCVQVDRLLFAGPEVFFPHVLRYRVPQSPSVAPSAVGGLAWLRQRFHAALNGTPRRRPSRLIVRRRSSTRRVVNEDRLSEMLVREWGFEEIHPETLSFSEQVRRFRDADVIVGAQGSAMSNSVFCTPGACVVSLCSTFAANFPSWADALERLGIRHCFVVGEAIEGSHPLMIQRDLHVDPNELVDAFAKLGVARQR